MWVGRFVLGSSRPVVLSVHKKEPRSSFHRPHRDTLLRSHHLCGNLLQELRLARKCAADGRRAEALYEAAP